jgi:hypothetical protein
MRLSRPTISVMANRLWASSDERNQLDSWKGNETMSVKQSRLLAVVGLLLVVAGWTVLVLWVTIGPTVYNSVPFLGVGIVGAGALMNRRSTSG